MVIVYIILAIVLVAAAIVAFICAKGAKPMAYYPPVLGEVVAVSNTRLKFLYQYQVRYTLRGRSRFAASAPCVKSKLPRVGQKGMFRISAARKPGRNSEIAYVATPVSSADMASRK